MKNFRKKYLKYKKKYLKCKNKLLQLKGGSASNIEPGSDIWEDFKELLMEDIELSEIELTTEVLNNYIQEIFTILDTIYNSDLNNIDDYLNQYLDIDENIVNAIAWYELVETLKIEYNITDDELLYFICNNGFFNEENIEDIIQHIQQNNQQNNQPQNIPIQQLLLLNEAENIRRIKRRRR
tara:strand:- start:328 stop:870 length:543 start_codon:yes stop_codon:yes gene_type:complete